MFKKYFIFCLLAMGLVFGFGCGQKNDQVSSDDSLNKMVPIESLEKTVYTSFIVLAHDWINSKESIATLNKVIDLHEKYQLPVDIYLDDQVTQVYLKEAPEIFERLKTSPFVAVSYHLRPPYPYYRNYDWLGLDKMSEQDLGDLLLDYEEHKIDLVTGQSTDEPGGYQLLKDLVGYPPYVVTVATVMGSEKAIPVLSKIYKDKGAFFKGGTGGWGEIRNGLWIRPESLEVKVYEPEGRKSGEEILTETLAGLTAERPVFLNLKWHEDNFFTSGASWNRVYYFGNNGKGPLSPPYDLSQAMVGIEVKTQAEKDEQWLRYEETLLYVKNHPEIFTAVNARDLAEMASE